jgi:Cys-rich protein (TIGR01571 family)
MMFPACYLCLRSHIRTKIRKQRGIKGYNETDDLLIVCFCPILSLVQESRELKTPVREAIVRQ